MDRKTTEFYNRYADDGAIRAESARSAVSAHFASAFKVGGKILDVGAGSGRDVAVLRQLGFDAYGIEPNEAMRAFAVQTHPELAGRLQSGSLPLCGRPFGGEFNGIVCSAILMHIAEHNLLQSAASLRALLQPQGRLLISLPFMHPSILDGERDQDGRFFINHSPEAIQSLLEKHGFAQIGRWENNTVMQQTQTLWFILLFELSEHPPT
jgi:SAM-dependent methyltransferase